MKATKTLVPPPVEKSTVTITFEKLTLKEVEEIHNYFGGMPQGTKLKEHTFSKPATWSVKTITNFIQELYDSTK